MRASWQGIWRTIVALGALGLMAAFAFGSLFTTFVPWDDEGYFLQAYHDLLSGHVLYDQVFAMYGPFTFWSSALVARFNAANVTHDTFRWMTLPVWVAIATLMAGAVWRWTDRFAPSLVAFLLVGFRLQGLAKGIGHPQVWILLVVAMLLWLEPSTLFQPGQNLRAFCIGLVLGVVLLCKINVGVYVIIAVALAFGLQLGGRFRGLACGVPIAAASVLGLSLFFISRVGSEKFFALAYLASLALTVGVALGRPVQHQSVLTSLIWLAGGLGVCLCMGVGVTLASGTTVRGLFKGLITTPALFAKSYHYPFLDATEKNSILLSAIGLAFIVGMFRWRHLMEAQPAWLGLLKATAGAGLLCGFAYNHRVGLTGSLFFLCLLIVDTPRMPDSAYSRRLFLALLALLFSLQVFPMAGEQVDWAAILPIVASTVLLADGTNTLDRETLRMHLPRLTSVAAQAAEALLAICLFLLVGGNALQLCKQWRDTQPLNLPGAHWLRLPPAQAARLTGTVDELRQNCQAVLLVPGLYSFSLWSGVPPVEEKRINTWPFLWPDEVQRNDLPRLQHWNRGCVLVSRDMYQFFRQFAVSRQDRLLSEVQRTLRPNFTLQDLTLYTSLPRPEVSANAYDATRP
jgi:hypothetical protein